MTDFESTNNTFDTYEQDIVIAARVAYGAEREGLEPDPERSRVDLLALMQPGDELRGEEIERKQAKVNVGVRAIVRSCMLLDTVDQGGVKGKLAKIELGLTRIFEHAYLKGAFDEGGVIERVRRPFVGVKTAE